MSILRGLVNLLALNQKDKHSTSPKSATARTAMSQAAKKTTGISKQALQASLPTELHPYVDNLIDSQKEFIKVEIEKSPNLTLTQSKVGGYPYFPVEMGLPLDSAGNHLDFLAQINFEDSPELVGYPTSGMLQFFIQRTESYGKDFGGAKGQNDYRVIYHEDTNRPARNAFPELDAIRIDGQYTSPNSKDEKFLMKFAKSSGFVSPKSIHFDQYFKSQDLDFFKQFGGKGRAISKAYKKLADSSGSKIGGYPDFTQDDPRFYDSSMKDWKLLFQLDSGGGIMWGDMGVGNFFIASEDLKNSDFSKVFYYWDCT
jgi:uncharacterized protein YwqG